MTNYPDINKTWIDDTLLCWAAGASNALFFTGWHDILGFADNNEIMQFYIDNYPDEGYYAYNALKEIFFYFGKETYFYDAVHQRSPHDLFMCKDLFDNGGAALLWLWDGDVQSDYNHIVTAYEIGCGETKHPKYPQTILLVDSDDNITEEYNHSIEYDYTLHRYNFTNTVKGHSISAPLYEWVAVEKCWVNS